jgi:hypothetical protein
VVLKGNDTVRLFAQWAKRNGILHDHSSGMAEAMEGE